MAKPVILCVDDEKIVLDSLKKELSKSFDNNFTIEIAESGEEGLEIIEELIEDNIEIPVVISDYVMPNMKGDEFLIETYSKLPDTKLLLLTGQATMEGVTNAVNNAKLYRYIAKPWESSDLAMTVKEAARSYYNEKELDEKGKALQQAYNELNKLDNAKTYFLGLLSHELNTPLIGINGNAKLIEAFTEDEEILESVRGILASENRLRKFADIAMLITRLQTEKYSVSKEEILISLIIDNAIFNLKGDSDSKNVEVIVDLQDDSRVEMDQVLITKVFDIILHNAIKFSDENSKVYITGSKDGIKYSVSIKDEGPGIDSTLLKNIFDLFQSDELMSHGEGYGLGLTAAKIILDSHNASILAKNNPDQGAEFILSFNLI